MITPEQKVLVQSTWAMVVPISETAADLFYTRLFEIDPTLRGMFKSDIKEQGKKLMLMIGTAVGGLERLDQIVPAVQALGKRHVGYGVKDEHYATVAAALLWTLEKGLGEAYTPDVAEAWTVTYTLLADVMKAAANAPAV